MQLLKGLKDANLVPVAIIIMQLLRRSKDTVWSPVTDHYVNKVIFFSVNLKCQDFIYVADKGIISFNN